MTQVPFIDVTDLDLFRSGDDETLLDSATRAIRSYCGWHIAPSAEDTLTVDGKGSRHLWLPTLHITEITTVTNDGTAVDLDDLDWSESGYLELRRGTWSTRPRGVVVELSHGWDEAPADVVEVAASLILRAAASPTGRTREQAGSVSISYGLVNGVSGGIALLAHERDILDKYRLPRRA